MIKSKVLTIPIYGDKYRILLYNDNAEVKEKYFGLDVRDTDGFIHTHKGKNYLGLRVYKRKGYLYPTPGIIAHECKHVVNKIFGDIGQELDRFNDEAECYLLGWLVNRVHEFTDKNKTDFKI